jgi:hypothetical protein
MFELIKPRQTTTMKKFGEFHIIILEENYKQQIAHHTPRLGFIIVVLRSNGYLIC